MRRRSVIGAMIATTVSAGLSLFSMAAASAAVQLPQVVSPVASSLTPNVFAGSATGTATVFGTAVVNGEVVVGGNFTQVCQEGPGSSGNCTGAKLTRTFIFAYDPTTGVIDPNFNPVFDSGPVYTVVAGPAGSNTVYVGGQFSTVNGETSNKGVVKLQVTPGTAATDGQVVTAFKGNVSAYARTLRLSPDGSALYAAGQFASSGKTKSLTGLVRMNATTGAVDPTFSFAMSSPILGSTTIKANTMTLSPDGAHLVVGGTFLQVTNNNATGAAAGAKSRPRLAMIDTGGSLGQTASLADFTVPILANNCSVHNYLNGADFSPDSSFFVIGDTGASASGASICDAAARFNLTAANTASTGTDNPNTPAWINWTGNDTIYTVAVTGGTVYIGGHFRWLSNQCGGDSLCEQNAVMENGIGVVDAHTGQTLPWWEPQTSRGHGVQSLETFPAGAFPGTQGGLLLGTDVDSIAGMFHSMLAMFSEPGTGTLTPGGAIPSGMFSQGRVSGVADMCINDASDGGPGSAVQLSTCLNQEGQVWTVESNGTIQANTGQAANGCMSPLGGATVNGTPIVLATCNGTAAQQWSQGAGNTLVNQASGTCLADPGASKTSGVQLQITTCSGGVEQTWPLPTAQAPPPPPETGPVWSDLVDGSKSQNLCLTDVNNSFSAGAQVDVEKCLGQTQATWTAGTTGTMVIHKLCLDTSGTSAVLAVCNGSSSQIWTPSSNFGLKNQASGLCLSDPNSGLGGTLVTVAACTSGSNQAWRLPSP